MDISTLQKFHIYSDESSQTKHRFLVLGATVCHANMAPKIVAAIDAAANPIGTTSEFKWGKVKRKNLPMYEAAIDAYFTCLEKNHAQFYALVVDTSQSDHNTYNDGDKEIGFSKYLFTLLYKFSRLWRPNPRFCVFLDFRTTTHVPSETRRMLNARVRNDQGILYDPYRQVQFCQSTDSRLIQITDVVMGAIAFATNGHDSAPGAAPYKIKLMQRIAKLGRVKSLGKATPYGHQRFDIWHLDFTKAKKK